MLLVPRFYTYGAVACDDVFVEFKTLARLNEGVAHAFCGTPLHRQLDYVALAALIAP